MAVQDMAAAREREWLVWCVRLITASLLGWTAYTTYTSSVTLEGVRSQLAFQSKQLDRLEAWKDSSKK